MSASSIAANDWIKSIRMAPLWYNLALEDLRDRYRRTVLGVAWIATSFALFVAVKVVVFGQMVAAPLAEFGLFVTIGFGLWSYINAMMVDACTVYMHARPWVLGTAVPYPVYILQAIARNLMIFGMTLIVMGLALFLKPGAWSPVALWAIPGLVAYLVTSLWLAAILAPLCARFRDIYHSVQTGLRLMFFVTPILWMPSTSPTLATIARWNPASSFLDIVREPLLYDRLPVNSWVVVLAINAVGLAAGAAAYSLTRKRIAYWV